MEKYLYGVVGTIVGIVMGILGRKPQMIEKVVNVPTFSWATLEIGAVIGIALMLFVGWVLVHYKVDERLSNW